MCLRLLSVILFTVDPGFQPYYLFCFQQNRCLLSTLSPGLIGKLQILKSGQCRLQLGESKMWLELGTQVAFKQVKFHYIYFSLRVDKKVKGRVVHIHILFMILLTFRLLC